MRLKFIIIILLALFNIASSKSYKDKDILLQITKDMCKSYEERNVEKLMSFWSKKSPDYQKTKNDLKKDLKNFEDIKITFSYRGSPQVVFKKNEATVVVENRITAKYIVKYPYKEKGDKINFVWKKDKDGKWKIVRMKMVKVKRHKGTKARRHREIKIKQEFKNKEEETLAKLSKEAIDCISKRNIKCFLKYNNCSFPLGYIRCRFTGIMFKIIAKGMKEEEMKISADEGKKIDIVFKGNKTMTTVNTKIEGKYKLFFPFEIKQTMTTTFRKEHGRWKTWEVVNKTIEDRKINK